MKKVDQPTPTSCFRACVATVLRLPVEDVPRACDGDSWDWDAFQDWLRTKGLQCVEVLISNPVLYPIPHPVPVILTGNSPRECVTGRHAVVAEAMGLDGFGLVHDPHPSRGFLEGEPTHACFFVPLRPWKLTEPKPDLAAAAVLAEECGLYQEGQQ